MAKIFTSKLTKYSSLGELLNGIRRVASDKNHRVLQSDDNEWLETKMREIRRLTRHALSKLD